MTDVTQGLPAGVQEALNGLNLEPALPKTVGFTGPQGNLYDTSSAPRVPPPQVPMRPAGQEEAPEAPQLDGVDVMANTFLTHLLQKDREANQPARPAAPGSFASKLGGAAEALGAGLGDAAAANNGGKGGWLGGVARTLNARESRLERQKQQQFENQERKRNDDINYAHAQVQTLLAQQTLRHADMEDRKAALTSDQDTAATLDQVGTPVISRNLDSDQVKAWVADPNNKDQAHQATALIDHFAPPDANGFQRPIYNLYGAVPQEVTLSKQNAELLTKYGATGQEYEEGSKIPGSSFVRNIQQAKTAQAADLVRQKLASEIYKNDQEGKKLNEEATEKGKRDAIAHDPGFISTMNSYGFRPLDALDAAKKMQDNPSASPEQKAAAAKFSDNINTFFGQDMLEKEREARATLAQKLAEQANARSDKQADKEESKGKDLVSKSTDAFAKNATQNAGWLMNIQKAKDGNELAASMTPLFTALGISTSEGVRRVNQTEIDQAGPRVGSLYRRLTNLLDKAGTGGLSIDQLNEARDIAVGLQSAAYDKYVRTALINKHNYNLADDFQILNSTGSGTQSLGEAKRQLERNDLIGALQTNGGVVPKGYQMRTNPQTKKSIYTTDGINWFYLDSGDQYNPPQR